MDYTSVECLFANTHGSQGERLVPRYTRGSFCRSLGFNHPPASSDTAREPFGAASSSGATCTMGSPTGTCCKDLASCCHPIQVSVAMGCQGGGPVPAVVVTVPPRVSMVAACALSMHACGSVCPLLHSRSM